MTNVMDDEEFKRVLAKTDSGEDGRLARRYIASHVTALKEQLEARDKMYREDTKSLRHKVQYAARELERIQEQLATAEMAFAIAEQRTADAQALCEQSQERVKELEWIIETLKTTAQGFRELDEGNFVTLQELEQTLNPRHEGE